MLVARSVSFAYSTGRPVLRGVDATLRAGEVCAIIGPNGAGKSTLLRLLLALLRPASGRVTLDGEDLVRFPARERARRLAYVPQRADLAFGFDVMSVVRLGCIGVGRARAEAVGARALERLELSERARDPLSSLSAGQQQRATLARALAQVESSPSARAILADEPVSAMDPRHAHLAMRVLRDLASRGLAVGVVLHDFTLAPRYATHTIVLRGSGEVASCGPFREACRAETLRSVFGVPFACARDEAMGDVLVPAPPDADMIPSS